MSRNPLRAHRTIALHRTLTRHYRSHTRNTIRYAIHHALKRLTRA